MKNKVDFNFEQFAINGNLNYDDIDKKLEYFINCDRELR